MKKIFLFSFLIFNCSFLMISCHCKKKATASAQDTTTQNTTPPPTAYRDFTAEGYTKAVVINYEVDGCTYLLQVSAEKKLEPSNLPQEFKKDKLDVWVKYAAKKGGMSTCMAGQMVDITDIQLRK